MDNAQPARRQLASGAIPAAKACRPKRAPAIDEYLAVLDAAVGPNTRKMVENACLHHGVRLLQVENLGGAVGREGRMAVAVLDKGMAGRVAELFDRENA